MSCQPLDVIYDPASLVANGFIKRESQVIKTQTLQEAWDALISVSDS